MNIPITARIKRAGQKGCGCGCNCKCGSVAKKIDDMHNGIPGVQKDDFKQFS